MQNFLSDMEILDGATLSKIHVPKKLLHELELRSVS